MRMGKWIAGIAVTVVLMACATSPTGRSQLMLISDAQVNEMGVAAFDQMKQESPLSGDARTNRYVSCVADATLAAMPSDQAGGWEVRVFEDETANAFALPGRKIGIHTGLLEVAVNEAQLVTVIGHEIGHVLAHHSAERMSLQFAAQGGSTLLAVLLGEATQEKGLLFAALGLGAQYGVLLPYSRIQESEADAIGLELMARAGFDPAESLALWRNMSSAGGEQPPEFLSTHPSHSTRITDLQRQLAQVQPLYEQARAQGRRPNCQR